MNFKELSIEEIKDICSEFGLDKKNNINQQYRMQYLVYRKLFTQYIIEKLNLKKYDNEIRESGLEFLPINELDMDSYQYFSSNILKYFYIRNNINIEKLNENELGFLLQSNFYNNEELNDDEREFIERTYEKVIFEDVLKNGEKCMIFYGPDSERFLCRNDAIAIGMRYDEFGENDLEDDKWDERHEKQLDFIEELNDRMQLDFQQKASIPISIIKYNEFSVKQRGQLETTKTAEDDFER